jgi:hypothetical protein
MCKKLLESKEYNLHKGPIFEPSKVKPEKGIQRF